MLYNGIFLGPGRNFYSTYGTKNADLFVSEGISVPLPAFPLPAIFLFLSIAGTVETVWRQTPCLLQTKYREERKLPG